MNMLSVKEPCPECPFRKDVTPGTLGGTPAASYIGQAHGPFTLPCHMHCDFTDPDWKAKAKDTPQCAGALAFRTHIGVADRMPAAMPRMPANEQVFADEYEFLAHHLGRPIEYVKAHVSPETFEALLFDQMWRAATGEKP